MQILEPTRGRITTLAFAPTGDLLIGLADGGVLHFAGDFAEIQSPIDTPRTSTPAATGIVVLPDGRRIIGTTAYATFEAPDGTLQKLRNEPVASLAVFREAMLVIGYGSLTAGPGTVELVRVTERIDVRTPNFKESKGVRCVAAHPALHRIAWSSGHQKVMLADPRKQDPKTLALKHTSPAIAFHPDGHTLAVAQEWGVKLFDPETLHETRSLAGHKGRVVCLAYSIDGRTLATGSWDGSVRLWNAETGQLVAAYEGATGKVFALAFSPDGMRLAAAAGETGTIVLWDLE